MLSNAEAMIERDRFTVFLAGSCFWHWEIQLICFIFLIGRRCILCWWGLGIIISCSVSKQEAELSLFCACLSISAIRNVILTPQFVLWAEGMLRSEGSFRALLHLGTPPHRVPTSLKSLFFCSHSDVQRKSNATEETPKLSTASLHWCLTGYWHSCLPAHESQRWLCSTFTEVDVQKLGLHTEHVWETVMRSLKRQWEVFFCFSPYYPDGE